MLAMLYLPCCLILQAIKLETEALNILSLKSGRGKTHPSSWNQDPVVRRHC